MKCTDGGGCGVGGYCDGCQAGADMMKATKNNRLRGKPFAKNAVVSNCRIIKAIPGGVLRRYKYDVIYGCCGKAGTLTHSQLVARKRNDMMRCLQCTIDKREAGIRHVRQYGIGETISHAVILDIDEADHRNDQVFTVRHQCCGKTQKYAWKHLRERQREGRTECSECAVETKYKKPGVRVSDWGVPAWGPFLGKLGPRHGV